MPYLPRRIGLHSATWLVGLCSFVGCGTTAPAPPSNVGTTTFVQLPESDPPVITKALTEGIRPGMTLEEVFVILRDASHDTPSAKSSIEAVYTQGKLNTIRYNVTVAQGKRRLVLGFKADKLVEKTLDGLD